MPSRSMNAVNLKITVKGINEVVKELQHFNDYTINKIVPGVQAELAKEGAKHAQQLFDKARYDGVNDVKVSTYSTGSGKGKSYQIIARGNATKYIEYGTGLKRDDPWYFYDKSKKVQLTAGGQHAKYKTALYGGPSGMRTYEETVKEYNKVLERVEQGDIARGWATNEKGEPLRLYRALQKAQAKDSSGNRIYQWHDKPYSYRTYGNKPNKCMYNTIKFLEEKYPEKMKRALKK